MKTGRSFPLLVALCMAAGSSALVAQSGADSAKHWVGTWACAPYRAESNTPPSPGLSNNTLRQIVRVSIGGDTLRVRFSNITSSKAVTLNKVNIAVSPDGTKSVVTASTITDLKFNGNANVTINAGAELYSDPVAFPLTPSMRLAITIYYGQCQTSADMTFHYGSRGNSYLLTGDKTTSADFAGATNVPRWFTIYSVDVVAPKIAAAVSITGNSITDGYGLTDGKQNRWTDIFSEALLKNPATSQIGVCNLGIGATLVTGASNGAQSGVDRYKHDVLGQSGVRWVIVFYGINDIGANVSANSIIDGLKKMVDQTRAQDTSIKVYGATITPCNGSSYYSPAHESVRTSVNTWIRTQGSFDACIDFDKTIRNPNDPTRLQDAYSNDWLHPNAAGYKLLGESIDLNLFEQATKVMEANDPLKNTAGELSIHRAGGAASITFEIPHEGFVSLKVYTALGKEIAELAGRRFSSGRHSVEFKGGHYAKGIYLYSLKAGDFSRNRIMVY